MQITGLQDSMLYFLVNQNSALFQQKVLYNCMEPRPCYLVSVIHKMHIIYGPALLYDTMIPSISSHKPDLVPARLA